MKLIGRGSYAVLSPGSAGTGHFGLAVHDYAHSTAPNRRYADLITQRLLKAAVLGQPCPYTLSELQRIADQCNARESDAHKVERQLRKSAAALHLSGRYGEIFPALITGKGPKGTWVRLIEPPAEGRLVAGSDGVEVGAKLQVRLRGTDVARGFIDFEQVGLA